MPDDFPQISPLQNGNVHRPAPSGVEILEAHGAGWSVSFFRALGSQQAVDVAVRNLHGSWPSSRS